jgi:DNA-binding MarR family transcriptional regulator
MTTPSPDLHHKSATLPKELVGNTCFLMARIGFAIKARAIEEYEQAGFSLYQYSVLALLAEGDSEAQSQIADVLGLDRSQLVGILDVLEERGLIARRRDPSDRRRHIVSVTAEGKHQLGRLRAIAKRMEDDFLAPLDADMREALREALQCVASCSERPSRSAAPTQAISAKTK